jgi:hypothetical protein
MRAIISAMTGSGKRYWILVAGLWLVFPLPVYLIVAIGWLPGVMLVPLAAGFLFSEAPGFGLMLALVALTYFGLAWIAGRQLYLFIHRRFRSHETSVLTVTTCALVAVSLLPIYLPPAHGPAPNQNLPRLLADVARELGLVEAITNVQGRIDRARESRKPLIERLESRDVTVQQAAWEEARGSPPEVRDPILRELLSSVCTIHDAKARDQRVSVIFYVVSSEILRNAGDYFVNDFLDDDRCPGAARRLTAAVPTHGR